MFGLLIAVFAVCCSGNAYCLEYEVFHQRYAVVNKQLKGDGPAVSELSRLLANDEESANYIVGFWYKKCMAQGCSSVYQDSFNRRKKDMTVHLTWEDTFPCIDDFIYTNFDEIRASILSRLRSVTEKQKKPTGKNK
jgi:hypothetical protein